MADEGLILIADDEPTVLRTMAALLVEEGYVCHRAESAAQAQELLAKHKYDLLLTDWKMPGNAELEFVKAVNGSGCTTPIVVITGYPQLAETMAAHGLKVFGELLKPFEFEDLLSIVRRGVSHAKSRREAS